MPALTACFEEHGFGDVATYIQSGNVLFTTRLSNRRTLTRRIEAALSTAFACQPRVVVCSAAQMRAIVGRAPNGFGAQPAAYRYDVIFLKDPLTAGDAMNGVSAKPGVDRVFAGEGVLYFSRLISKAAQSHLSRVTRTPAYQHMTVRNWNTTRKLLELLERLSPAV